MKILVTGSRGQLGYDLCKELKSQGFEQILAIDKDDVDITNEMDIKKVINEWNPNMVIHCAAWTNVDKAEDNPEEVYKINALGTKYIAEACRQINAKMVYISTDYVFSGEGTHFYKEEDEKKPLGVYGKTKLNGEEFVKSILDEYFLIRISWVFGINGNNFIKTMLRLSENNDEISVVDDQIGSPTYTRDISKLITEMIQTTKYGIYHATNEGICSWFQFAKYIFKVANVKINVLPISTKEYQQKYKQAFRPLNSRMSKEKLASFGFKPLPSWQNAVERFIIEELNYNSK